MILPAGRHAIKLLEKLVNFVSKEFTTKDSQAFFHLKEALRLFKENYGERTKNHGDV